jgi:PBP1b-binding outer membrane lipoprotein LpoB
MMGTYKQRKNMKIAFMVLALALLSVGCYQTSDEDGLRATPVTNNPSITPQRDMGPMQAMPY